jgi:hypothetical protein
MAKVLEIARAAPGVAEAFDTTDHEALRARGDTLATQVLHSLHPATSGDVLIVPERFSVADIGVSIGKGTTHGSPHAYDTHVPVFVWGERILVSRHGEPVDQRRVASTLAALLRIPTPLADAPPSLLP